MLAKNLGVWGLIRYLVQRLRQRFSRGILDHRIDVFSFYDFLRAPEEGEDGLTDSNIEAKTLNWVIPGFQVGSGGHLNIFRMAWHLEQLGYKNHIVIVGNQQFSSGEAARKSIRKHFVPLQASVSLGETGLLPAEFTIATSWDTAYPVRRFSATRYKVYFIQDMEPYFYPHGSDYVFAEATYGFGFIAITAGSWLAEVMRNDYGMKAYPFSFSYEKDRYVAKPRRSGPRRVFFYARSVTPRRGFELGLLALKRVHQRLPDVEFVLAGWDCSSYLIPFPHLNAGVVALDDLPDLYSQCDAALVLSLTNISLLPLELMACGCPLVSNRGKNVEWLLKDGETALLANPNPVDIANALVRLLEDSALRARLAENGLTYARGTDWAVEAEKVHGYLQTIRKGDGGFGL